MRAALVSFGCVITVFALVAAGVLFAVSTDYYSAAAGVSDEGYQASFRAAGLVLLVGVLLGLALAFVVTRPPARHEPSALEDGNAQELMRASSRTVWQQATLRARSSNPRDALIGGSILGVALALLGFISIVTAPDHGIESLRSPTGYVLLGLAVILGVSAVRGGRRGRYSAGVVSVALGGLLMAGYGLPLAAFAAPFFVSAYLLLRSN